MSLEKINQEEIPIYTFGAMTFKDLENLVKIKRNISTEVFSHWFEAEIQITDEDKNFFNALIK